MGNLTIATLLVVFINVLLGFVSYAMLDINPGGSSCYDSSGTIAGELTLGSGDTMTVNNNVNSLLPEASSSSVSSGTTGVWFIDIFNSILTWVKTTGKFILTIATAPVSVLTCLGLPAPFVAGVSIIWYSITVLLLVAFLFGRGD